MGRRLAGWSLRGLALVVGAGIALTVGASGASAAPVIGGQLFATGGAVEVEVLPANAGFTSELWLFAPEERYLGVTNHDDGAIVTVGTFPAGTELVFGIKVLNTNQTFKMGPGDRNPDGIPHAAVDDVAPGVANVGFEDLLGGGDLDYDDNIFQFRGGIAPNRPPVANNDSYTTAEDTDLIVPAPGVLGNDTDGDGDTLTVISGTSPDGSFVYVPPSNFCGTTSFDYTISDGNGGTATATVTITVTCVNDAPVANHDAYTTAEDTALTVPAPGVLANDTDADGDTLTVTTGTNGDGSFTYTPPSNFCGTELVDYTVSDGHGGIDGATVEITVTCGNDPPVANNDAYTTAEETALTVPAPGVLGNDTDAEGDALTSVIATGPSHGTVTVNPNGSFTYTPAFDFHGTDTFTYTATDANGGVSAPATVTITVTNVKEGVILDAKPIIVKLFPGITLYVVKLEATLNRADNGAPIPGKKITFSAAHTSAHCTATTNANGVARCEGIFKNIIAVLNIRYTATFAGDADFNGASDEGVIAVVGPLNII